MTSTETEDVVRRRTAITDYRKRLLQHKELNSRVCAVRENLRGAKKEFGKTEDDLKSLQSVGQISLTREELDRYLEASQIRQRAIERVTNVVGTYGDAFPIRYLFYACSFICCQGYIFGITALNVQSCLLCIYDDLRLRIFTKHPDLFPEEVDTFLDYDKSSQGVVFTTAGPYQPGEQVFISYGKKLNGELLLSYGFVPSKGTNPSDSVELSVSLLKSDKCYKEKVEALRKYGLSA